ncbi:MAG: hypothetical protein Q8Q59_15760 [Luteolibacter sp.]|nr:hypothetical protein [Luteolibacter sp.]
MSVFNHRPPYSISGQSGKALGPARISLEEFGITALTPDFRSMEADTVQWIQRGGTAPEYLQEIAIWDADGKRVFAGTCTVSDPEWDGSENPPCAVTISGPWWWLEQAQLTALETDSTGAEAERASYLFPSQDLAISIRALIDRMAALGCPIQCGDIDPTFRVPQMVFQGQSAASALLTMLGWIPDASTWVRYDTGGLPSLNVTRRATAPLHTFELGTDSNLTGVPRLKLKRDLRPSEVRVQTMEVNSLGEVIYSEQVAGDAGGTPLGRQFIALSGPGRGDFRSYEPRVATLQTAVVPSLYQDIFPLAQAFDPVIMQVEAEKGAVGFFDYGYNGHNNPNGGYPTGLTGVGSYRLIGGQVVDFLKTEFSIVESETRISGWVLGTYDNVTGWSAAVTALRERFLAFSGFSGGTYNLAVYVDFVVPTINNSYPSLTVFVHPEDQALVSPVPDLAGNLFAAQDWPVWTGEFPLHPGSPIPLAGDATNIRGARPEWATMRAPISGTRINLQTGAAALTLGPSQRTAAATLLSQFQRPASGRVINP